LARLDESIAAFNQRFIFPLHFAMKIIKINLWNQGTACYITNMQHTAAAELLVFKQRPYLKLHKNILYDLALDTLFTE
jgi:hypothetical protein